MFALHERTKRRLGQLTLVLFALAPAVAVATWTLWMNRPGAEEETLIHLMRLTGLDLEAAPLRRLNVGQWRCARIVARRPETREPLAVANEVRLTQGPEIEIRCGRLETAPRLLGALCEITAESLLARPGRPSRPVRLTAEDVVLAGYPANEMGGNTPKRLVFESEPGGARRHVRAAVMARDGASICDIAISRTLHNGQVACESSFEMAPIAPFPAKRRPLLAERPGYVERR